MKNIVYNVIDSNKLNQYTPTLCGQKILCRVWYWEGAYGTKISMPPDSAQRIFWELCGQKILCRAWYWEGAYGT